MRFECPLFTCIGRERCPFCQCYACNEPAFLCKDWDLHCFANPKGLLWRDVRKHSIARQIIEESAAGFMLTVSNLPNEIA